MLSPSLLKFLSLTLYQIKEKGEGLTNRSVLFHYIHRKRFNLLFVELSRLLRDFCPTYLHLIKFSTSLQIVFWLNRTWVSFSLINFDHDCVEN